MIDILSVFVLILFCISISFWEYSQFKTFITPFNVITWPYIIIALMINCIGKYFGFFPVSFKSIFFVIGCLSFFILGKIFISTCIDNKSKQSTNSSNLNIDNIFKSYRSLFIIIAYISIIAGLIHFHSCIKEFGWRGIASYDFRNTYGSGLLSHIMLISRPAFIFIFAYYLYSKKKTLLFPLLLIFIMVIIRQVKYHVIILLLGGIYFSFSYHLIRINFKKIFYLIIIIYTLFNLSYTIGFSTLGVSHAYSSKVQTFLFNHFFTYLFGGVIGCSEILNNTFYPLYSIKEIFAVPVNIVRVLNEHNELVDIIIRNWIPVSNIHKYFHNSNVFGLFGMLYAYMGVYLTFLYLFISGIIIYGIYNISIRNDNKIVPRLISIIIMSFLTLSFFGFYFNMLAFAEIIISTIILILIFNFIKILIQHTTLKYRSADNQK